MIIDFYSMTFHKNAVILGYIVHADSRFKFFFFNLNNLFVCHLISFIFSGYIVIKLSFFSTKNLKSQLPVFVKFKGHSFPDKVSEIVRNK